ncbi:MAG: hypothetical protein ABSD74_03030 [Rhizomicrobium sp.]|jgi:hypothetical protein
MKILALAAFGAAVIATSSQAQPVPNGLQSEGGNGAGPVCLRPFDVAGPANVIRTHVVDPRTILFYMPNGKVWVNHLSSPCRGLMFHGFEYLTRQDELCSNQVSIRVIESGEVCKLGAFAPYTQSSANP